MLSVFDIFKIGIGPSSSHTMGPMVAASRFFDDLQTPEMHIPGAGALHRIEVRLHGSLAFTGKGHATDLATIYGLLGFAPESFSQEDADRALQTLRETKTIAHPAIGAFHFDPELDLIFDYEHALEAHANGMTFSAYDAAGNLYAKREYYSIGGGFVATEDEIHNPSTGEDVVLPFAFRNTAQLLEMGRKANRSIYEMAYTNEKTRYDMETIEAGLEKILATMEACQNRGLSTDGILPGGLKVRRRAKGIYEALKAEYGQNMFQPHTINDWIACYAMAVNEENAAGGQVVTSPTNGAAGVVPAVIRYYLDHIPGASRGRIREFLLVAGTIGGIIKSNASISGAECGCQAEVGSASAMAAAGLAHLLGGDNEQIENAAEIALEHHLGMTCDPIKGLVQVPCIERNGLGAIKAISAASLALRGDGQHLVSLDACIETMRQTGHDMDHRYKETSLGGLAVNIPEC